MWEEWSSAIFRWFQMPFLEKKVYSRKGLINIKIYCYAIILQLLKYVESLKQRALCSGDHDAFALGDQLKDNNFQATLQNTFLFKALIITILIWKHKID